MRKTLEERFWEKVIKKHWKQCWLWQACTSPYGYGRMSIYPRGSYELAHRLSWLLSNGKPPGELCVLHKCDNPPCVNPHHLFLGTKKDNNDDKVNKDRQARLKGSKHPNTSLTEDGVREIRLHYALGKVSYAELGMFYDVTKGVVAKIVQRRTWKHVR